MSDQLFRETHVPLPRRTRAKNAVAGFFTHPTVIVCEEVFLIGVVASVIYVVVKNGWLS